MVFVCSHSATALSGAVSHHAEDEQVSVQVGDGRAVEDEADKPTHEHANHSRNGPVSTSSV